MPDAVTALLARTASHQAGAWRLLIAVAAVTAFVPLLFARRSASRARLLITLAVAITGAALGASLLPILLRLPAAFAGHSLTPLLAGDRMAIGALAGFAVAAGLAARRLDLDPARALDRLAPAMAILVIAGRIGCFLEGCDFGAVSRLPWAIRYPAGSHAFARQLALGLVHPGDVSSLPVHPAQLYEVLVGAVMLALALALQRRRPATSLAAPLAPGTIFRASLATYAVGRFVVELFRGDVRGALGPLSLPQWLALALLAWSVAGALDHRRALRS